MINSPLFPHVTEVILETINELTIISPHFYSNPLNPVHLVKISFNIYFDHHSTEHLINAISDLLRQVTNLHTFHSENSSVDGEIICRLIPRQVKYLQMKTDQFDSMKTIVKDLDHLSSIAFQYRDQLPDLSHDFLQ